jgi:GNAT superfamily N-acetyltransferase
VPPQIRRAKAADAPGLARLRLALRIGTERITEPPNEFLRRCTDWMTRELGGSAWRCWLAEMESDKESELLGAVWLCRIPKIPNPGGAPESHAYLSNFFVQPYARGRGIGSQLLQAAMSWCKVERIDSVVLWPTEESRPLYLRNGFRVPVGILDRPISAHF